MEDEELEDEGTEVECSSSESEDEDSDQDRRLTTMLRRMLCWQNCHWEISERDFFFF